MGSKSYYQLLELVFREGDVREFFLFVRRLFLVFWPFVAVLRPAILSVVSGLLAMLAPLLGRSRLAVSLIILFGLVALSLASFLFTIRLFISSAASVIGLLECLIIRYYFAHADKFFRGFTGAKDLRFPPPSDRRVKSLD